MVAKCPPLRRPDAPIECPAVNQQQGRPATSALAYQHPIEGQAKCVRPAHLILSTSSTGGTLERFPAPS
jgi:hypothetical protein